MRFVPFEARPAGLLFDQLVRASDLSTSQIRSWLAAPRDRASGKGRPPLIWTRVELPSLIRTGRAAAPGGRYRSLPLLVSVTPRLAQRPHAAEEALFRLRLSHPEITIDWADSVYAGKLATLAAKNLVTRRLARKRGASDASFVAYRPVPKPRRVRLS